MKMSLTFILGIATMVPSSAAVLRLWQNNFLSQGMQPEVVARTLTSVEDEWKAQAAVFADCNGTEEHTTIVNCEDAPGSFAKSCGTVVNAIVQGSGGDRDVTKEYMTDVCGQALLSGWHQQHCNSLATEVNKAMTADKYVNRISFNTSRLCTGFWSQFLSDEQARLTKEKADQEAAEKKAVEEAAEKERLHQEEEKKKAEERKAEEVAHAKEEAQAKAANAKAKAAEAAEKAAQKLAEAEEVARVAQEKKEEAEKAIEEHQESLKRATASVDENANTSEATAPAEVTETPSPVAMNSTADSEDNKTSAEVQGIPATKKDGEEKKEHKKLASFLQRDFAKLHKIGAHYVKVEADALSPTEEEPTQREMARMEEETDREIEEDRPVANAEVMEGAAEIANLEVGPDASGESDEDSETD